MAAKDPFDYPSLPDEAIKASIAVGVSAAATELVRRKLAWVREFVKIMQEAG